jgi:hypothetical protein
MKVYWISEISNKVVADNGLTAISSTEIFLRALKWFLNNDIIISRNAAYVELTEGQYMMFKLKFL